MLKLISTSVETTQQQIEFIQNINLQDNDWLDEICSDFKMYKVKDHQAVTVSEEVPPLFDFTSYLPKYEL